MKKRLFHLLSLLIMVLGFVSCGTAKQPEKKLEKVTLVLDWVPNTNHTGIFVAKDKGYFEEEGIDLEIVQPAEDSSATVVGAGKAELGIYFQPNLVKKLLKNTPITAIAAILQKNTAGLMCLKSLGAKTPKDLEGKRYSTWQDPIDDATVKTLVGDKLQEIPGESTDATAGLVANQYDFIIVYSNWDLINARLKKVDVDFFPLAQYEPIFDYYTPVLIANNDFLKNKPEVARKVLKALEKGYRFAVEHPDEAANILIKNAPEGNPELIRESQKSIVKYYLNEKGEWGKVDIAKWDRFYNWLYEKKLIDKKLDSGAGVTNEYLGH